MAKKLTYSDIRNVMDTVPTQAAQAHYVVGAYQVMLAGIVADLPKHKQAEFIRSIESLAIRVSEIPSTY